MEVNEAVVHLETHLKVNARIGEQAHAKALPKRDIETMVNPSKRMQQGGYNTEPISSSLGENLQVNLPISCNCQCLMVTFNNDRNSGIFIRPPFMNSRLCQQFPSSVI